jgi:hypothetical protein
LEILLGAIGALLTAAGLGWSIWRSRRDRQPDVEVKVSYAMLTHPEPRGVIWLDAVNRGDRLVWVTSVGFDTQDGTGRTIVLTRLQPYANLPGSIEPNARGSTYLPADVDALDQAPLDPRLPVVGWVQLATGEKITSKPRTLMARS